MYSSYWDSKTMSGEFVKLFEEGVQKWEDSGRLIDHPFKAWVEEVLSLAQNKTFISAAEHLKFRTMTENIPERVVPKFEVIIDIIEMVFSSVRSAGDLWTLEGHFRWVYFSAHLTLAGTQRVTRTPPNRSFIPEIAKDYIINNTYVSLLEASKKWRETHA
jgi:hypothetical protein